MTYKPKTTPQDRKDLITDLEEHFFFYDSADPFFISVVKAIISDLEAAEALLRKSVQIPIGESVAACEHTEWYWKDRVRYCKACGGVIPLYSFDEGTCFHPYHAEIHGRLHCMNCGKLMDEPADDDVRDG